MWEIKASLSLITKSAETKADISDLILVVFFVEFFVNLSFLFVLAFFIMFFSAEHLCSLPKD